jgi:hypothetical protein
MGFEGKIGICTISLNKINKREHINQMEILSDHVEAIFVFILNPFSP